MRTILVLSVVTFLAGCGSKIEPLHTRVYHGETYQITESGVGKGPSGLLVFDLYKLKFTDPDLRQWLQSHDYQPEMGSQVVANHFFEVKDHVTGQLLGFLYFSEDTKKWQFLEPTWLTNETGKLLAASPLPDKGEGVYYLQLEFASGELSTKFKKCTLDLKDFGDPPLPK